MLQFSGVAVSHPGLVREGNEDSGFAGPTCLLVADGVGGAAAGEVASATVAYVVTAVALARSEPDARGDAAPPVEGPAEVLQQGVDLAQQQLALGVRRDERRTGMATTLTALATDGTTFALAHVGDSRGYVLREGRLSRLTRDDTFVQRLVEDGTLSVAEAPHHPWRHLVLRSLDGDPDEHATITALDLRAGDRVLLASDGLTDLVSEVRIEHLLAQHHDDAAAGALLDAALDAGGRDNVTCLVATVVDAPPLARDGALVGAVRDPRLVVDAAAVRMPHTA